LGDEGGLSSTVVGDFTVEANSGETPEELTQALTPDKDKSEPDEKTDEKKKSEAASELGKAGGKASAEKRAAEAQEAEKDKKPDTQPPEAEGKPKETKPEEPDTEPAKEEPKPEPKPRDDPQARMLQATRKEAEAKRERDAAQAEAARLRAELDARTHTEAPKPELKPRANGKPRSTDFPDSPEGAEQYLDARDKYNRDQWTQERQERDAVAEVDRTIRTHANKLHSVLTEAGIDIVQEGVLAFKPEFSLPEGATPNGENWIANELISSPEHAPALVLHFQEHPDALQRIAALSNPRAVSRAMASLETRLAAVTAGPSVKPEEEVSKAPPPIVPVKGAPYVAEAEEPNTSMGFDKYHAVSTKRQRSQR